MERSLGVTGPQRLVIRIVGQAPNTSAGVLAETMRIHPSSLTGIPQRLKARGLISRVADPRDARRVLLRLTAAGCFLDVATAGTVEEAVRQALERLPAGRSMPRGLELRVLTGCLNEAPGTRPARPSPRWR